MKDCKELINDLRELAEAPNDLAFIFNAKALMKNVADALEDAVEVVRCKDCKYWECGDCYRLELSKPDDFCSYGVRTGE